MDYTRNWLKRNPENFPVASWLLPKAARAPILAFYAFARGADEIADDIHMSAEQRQHALLSLEMTLMAGEGKLPEFAKEYSMLILQYPPLLSYGRDLLSAFVQDTVKTRYHDYNDLIDYCQRSAAPVGRAVLTLCGEKAVNLAASDALCNALQILNHIQDCSDDYVNRDRVYLPLAWFALSKITVAALAASEASLQLRQVIDHGLDNCDQLLTKAKPLFKTIEDKRLRKEIRLIYLLAQKLSARLRKHDPLQSKIRVGKLTVMWCTAKALISV